MFSAYVKAHHRYPKIVVSFLESNNGLLHSCHTILEAVSVEVWVISVMLVTYTEYGVRLSCSQFEGFIPIHRHPLRGTIMSLVDEHRRVGFFHKV